MSDALAERVRARMEARIEALAEQARAELPPGLFVERRGDGIAIGGRGLARALAFDARLRGIGR